MDNSWRLSDSSFEGDERSESIPYVLRSLCRCSKQNRCPMGGGIPFNSRITPSPKKSTIRSRRRRKSNASLSFNYSPIVLLKRVDEYVFKGKLDAKKLEYKPRSLYFEGTQSDNIQMSTDLSPSNDEIQFIPGTEFFAHQDLNQLDVTSDYSSGSNTSSRLKESTRRLTLNRPSNRYISYSSDEELEEWWDRDKTDYTYSSSLSYREQITPDRRIESPNMSRQGLKSGGIRYCPSPPFSHTLEPESHCNTMSLRSRNVLREILSKFSDESDVEESFNSVSKYKTSSSQYNFRTEKLTSSTPNSTLVNYGLDDDFEFGDDFSKVSIQRPSRRSHISTSKRQSTHSVTANTNGVDRDSIRLKKRGTSVISFLGKPNDKLSNYFVNFWKKSKYLATVLFTYLYLWSFTLLTKVTSIFTKANQRSRNLDLSQTMSTRRTRSQNTTSKMQSMRSANSISQGVVKWYKTKRKLRPFLWFWLPLCLLFALLIFSLPYLSGGSGFSSNHPFPSSNVIDIHSGFISGLRSLIKGFSFAWTKSWDLVSRTALSLWNLILYIFNLLKTCASLMVDVFSYLTMVTELSSASLETEKHHFSPLQSLTNAGSFVLSILYSGFLSLWEYSLAFFNFVVSLFINLFRAVLWVLNGIVVFCEKVFLVVEFSFFNVINYCALAVSKVLGFLQNPFHALSYDLSPDSSDETSHSPSESRNSFVLSQEQIDQILSHPNLMKLMATRIQEEHGSLNLSPDKLNALLKVAVDAEVEKMRKEMEEAVIQLKASTLSEVEKLQKQHDIINLQLNEILSSRRDFETKFENTEKSHQETTQSILNLTLLVDNIGGNVDELNTQIKLFKSELDVLSQRLKSCCDQSPLTLAQVEKHVSSLLMEIIGLNSSSQDDGEGILSSKLGLWMDKYFLAKDQMEAKLKALWDKVEHTESNNEMRRATEKQSAEQVMNLVLDELRSEIRAHQEAVNDELVRQSKVHEAMKDTFVEVIQNQTRLESQNMAYSYPDSSFTDGITELQVRKIVKQALSKYDADKTGLVDHALESAGGSIVSTRCTEDYQGHQEELTIFGYSILRYSTNTPRSIIQPDRMPGQCYSFKGSQGYIVILLAGPVKITSFSVEHIPKDLVPNGTIDSAPKDFSVQGFLHSPDDDGVSLGSFVYNSEGEPLQHFPVIDPPGDYFKFVELKVHSNHGNFNYTCIYRFRVHGIRL